MKTLQAWVQHNPQYHGLEIIEDAYSDGSLMDEVTQLMLQAAAHAEKQSPVGGGSGVADVQVVLGVLYNVTRNFSGAVGAFLKAAEARPGDYSVWNKLGATRANSMASEAAVPAYHRALALKPRYARGWLNLGIAHANLGHGASAARCYLHALELNPDARHIWNYVRMALTATDRYDLVPLANAMDAAALRQTFPPIPNDDPKVLESAVPIGDGDLLPGPADADVGLSSVGGGGGGEGGGGDGGGGGGDQAGSLQV